MSSFHLILSQLKGELPTNDDFLLIVLWVIFNILKLECDCMAIMYISWNDSVLVPSASLGWP